VPACVYVCACACNAKASSGSKGCVRVCQNTHLFVCVVVGVGASLWGGFS